MRWLYFLVLFIKQNNAQSEKLGNHKLTSLSDEFINFNKSEFVDVL